MGFGEKLAQRESSYKKRSTNKSGVNRKGTAMTEWEQRVNEFFNRLKNCAVCGVTLQRAIISYDGHGPYCEQCRDNRKSKAMARDLKETGRLLHRTARYGDWEWSYIEKP